MATVDSQAPLRHMENDAYRCFLPDLAGVASVHCAGPGYQQSPHFYQKNGKPSSPLQETLTGGERGIRTLGALLMHIRFPGVPLRPLGHLSLLRLKMSRLKMSRLKTRYLAEREGFEPPVPVYRNSCFRDSPLRP